MTSPDAIHWTTRDSGTTNYIERIAWAGRWVAACEGGDIITSTNGVDWALENTYPPSDHEGVAYGDGYWLVAGGYFRNGPEVEGNAASTVFFSTNAVQWKQLALDLGVRLRDVAFGDGKFVCVGNDGHVVVLSATNDLASPIRAETSYVTPVSQPFGLAITNHRRIVFSNGLFVIVGNDGSMMSSSNPLKAESWVQHRSRSSQNLHDILAAEDGSFYTVGNNGMILRSGIAEPYFTHITLTARGVVMEFHSIPSAGPLRLEESSDMQTWRLVAAAVVSPVELPLASFGARYFRLMSGNGK
jgi:hypothetical protein